MPSSGTFNGELITWREAPRQEFRVTHNSRTTRRAWPVSGSLNRATIELAAASIIDPIDYIGNVGHFLDDYEVRELGGDKWLIDASYRNTPAYWELSIDMAGGTTKILQSLQTKRAYDCTGSVVGVSVAPEDAISLGLVPDFKKAINVNGNTVEGCDVPDPRFDFQVNYKFQISVLSASYLMTLYNLTGRTNASAYALTWQGQSLTFAAGDLAFLGAGARQTSDDQVDITFRFSARKGLGGGGRVVTAYVQPAASSTVVVQVSDTTYFTLGSTIYVVDPPTGTNGGYYTVSGVGDGFLLLTNLGTAGNADAATIIPAGSMISADGDETPIAIGDSDPLKRAGWEFVWVRYEESTDAATQRLIRKPIAAYVEKVLRDGNFAGLNIA